MEADRAYGTPGLLVSRKHPTAAAKGAQLLSMRFLAVIAVCLIASPAGAIAAEPTDAPAQSGSVLVNGEVISPEDIEQRTRLMNLGNHFGDRIKAVLMGDETKQTFRERLRAANPHSQEEAQAEAERIKAALIAETRTRLLVEGGVTRKDAVDALIGDRVKLQGAKRLGIEITDEEADGFLKGQVGGKAGDLSKYYAQLEEMGISRRTVLDVVRARLAYRAVFARYYREREACAMGPFKHYARSCLRKLERDARIDYRDL
jgi:peptidyl-prolyl cis-trans isomerase SurA